MALLGIALAGGVAAADDTATAPKTYKPFIKYQSSSGSGKVFQNADQACHDSADGLSKSGIKQTFVKSKPGKDEWSKTCVLKRQDDGSQWDQENAVSVLTTCEDGSRSTSDPVSTHKPLGSIASQVCPCDPVKGCVVDDCGMIDRRDDRCFPPKQDVKRSPREAARISAANEAKAKSQHGDMVDKYNAAKKDIEKARATENQATHGPSARGFPSFSNDDLCDVKGPTDVNIGLLCGFDDGDFAAANAVAGYAEKPKDCTWHHSEDLGRFVLLKKTNHADAPHWGGRAIWKKAFDVPYPSHCSKESKH